MRLRQYLNEIKSNAKITYKEPDRDFKAKIVLDDVTWIFSADWGYQDDLRYKINFTSAGSMYGKTLKSNVGIKTFAAMEKVTREFIKRKKPELFTFTGPDDKVKLYDMLAKKIVKSGQYKLEKPNRYEWVFRKKS